MSIRHSQIAAMASAPGAVLQVQQYIADGLKVAVDIDLSNFFDRVDHDILMARVRKHCPDKRVMKLIGKYLRAGVEVAGVLHNPPMGVPQGGPLSPLLANIVLDDLDKHLESLSIPFARYADDFVVCVDSKPRGEQVKDQISQFLEKHLKLQVNESKSKVVATNALNFLGFGFRGMKICWSDKTMANLKFCVRQLTARSRGISMAKRFADLRSFLEGWMGYYSLSGYYRPIPGLDEWLRRRIRMCYLKQWNRPRTRIRNLLKLGVPKLLAVTLGRSSKGPIRLAKTQAVHWGLSNKYLKDQGLVSFKELWVKFKYS